jgi:hypothetical protein
MRKLTLGLLFSQIMILFLYFIYKALDINYYFTGQDPIELWVHFPTFSVYFGW